MWLMLSAWLIPNCYVKWGLKPPIRKKKVDAQFSGAKTILIPLTSGCVETAMAILGRSVKSHPRRSHSLRVPFLTLHTCNIGYPTQEFGESYPHFIRLAFVCWFPWKRDPKNIPVGWLSVLLSENYEKQISTCFYPFMIFPLEIHFF